MRQSWGSRGRNAEVQSYRSTRGHQVQLPLSCPWCPSAETLLERWHRLFTARWCWTTRQVDHARAGSPQGTGTKSTSCKNFTFHISKHHSCCTLNYILLLSEAAPCLGMKCAISQGTELAPEHPPCWDCLRTSYSAGGDREGQKNP